MKKALIKHTLSNDFIGRLHNIKNFSQATVDSYSLSLEYFHEFLQNDYDLENWIENPEKIELHMIQWFVSDMRSRWVTARSSNTRLYAIKKYFFYLSKIRKLNVLDSSEIETAKEIKKPVGFLTEDQQYRLIQWAYLDQKTTPLSRIRNTIIIIVMLFTWMRVSELLQMKVNNTIWRHDIQIHWKWWVNRVTCFRQWIVDFIKKYIQLREDWWLHSNRLFISHDHFNEDWSCIPLTRNCVHAIIYKLAKRLWFHCFPHMLRHTFAVNMLKNWANLYLISRAMWHANVSTTSVYLWASNSDIYDQINNVHIPEIDNFMKKIN